MGNIVCKKKSVIAPSGMCGKCPVCLGHPGFGHCSFWRKEIEIIKCGVCPSCLGTPGTWHCPFWKNEDEEPIEIIKCGVCSSCITPGLGPCTLDPVISQYDLNSGMNDANRKVLQVLVTEGQPAAFKAMFTGEQGQELSYSEMRARYG